MSPRGAREEVGNSSFTVYVQTYTRSSFNHSLHLTTAMLHHNFPKIRRIGNYCPFGMGDRSFVNPSQNSIDLLCSHRGKSI